MTDLRKAAEMALEALHNIDQSNNDDAIEALRQALAQPEQEPVAWLIQYKDRHEFVWCNKTVSFKEQVLGIEPLYTASPHHASDVKKREWDSEFLAGVEWAAKAIEAKLKEKNNG